MKPTSTKKPCSPPRLQGFNTTNHHKGSISMSSLALSFNDVNFTPVQQDNQAWITSRELGQALGYSREDAVNKIFERNSDEFTGSMTRNVKLTLQGQAREVRVFSLRGCHLIAMFARTKIAKSFRVWVLNVLESNTKQANIAPQITSIEDLLNASVEQGKTATEICNQVTKAENISFGMGSLHGKGLNKRKKEKKILKELQAITLKWMQFKLPFIESKSV